MSWYSKNLTASSVYWPPPVRDGIGGYTWSAPETVASRWQYTTSLVYSATEGSGSEIVQDIYVWLIDSLEVGGYLYEADKLELGGGASISEIKGIVSVEVHEDALQIISIKKIYSLSNSSIIYYRASVRVDG